MNVEAEKKMTKDNIHGEWYDKYESKPRGGKMKEYIISLYQENYPELNEKISEEQFYIIKNYVKWGVPMVEVSHNPREEG